MKKIILFMLTAIAFAGGVEAAEAPAQYSQYCAVCHGSGMAGAPKTGDAAVWASRTEAAGGVDGLVQLAKVGKGMMPPMGGCMDCTDSQLKEVIEYMSK